MPRFVVAMAPLTGRTLVKREDVRSLTRNERDEAMMIRAAGPGGGVIHALSLSENRRKLPPWMWSLIAISLLFHVAMGVLIYRQKFVAPPAPPPEPRRIMGVFNIDPPPLTPSRTPPRNLPQIHNPPIDPTTPTTSTIVTVPDAHPVTGIPAVVPTTAERPGQAMTQTPVQTTSVPVIGNPSWVSNAEQPSRTRAVTAPTPVPMIPTPPIT